MSSDFPAVVLLSAALAAAVTDATWRRIPNALTVPLAVAGVFCGAAQEFAPGVRLGLPSLVEIAVCVAVALAVCVPLWRRGALGGGDAKLLVGVAAWAGAADALEIVCSACAVGLVLALVSAWSRGELFALLGVARVPEAAAPPGTVATPAETARSRRFPFGVAVFVGTCAWWLAGRTA